MGLIILAFAFQVNALYSGETEQINIALDVVSNYTLIGNTSAINVLIDNLTANITIPNDYEEGSFTIIFNGYLNKEEAKVIVAITDSPSGCLTTYNCSDWQPCINNSQIRICNKLNSYCYAKPIEIIRNCSIDLNKPLENNTQNNNLPQEFNKPINWLLILSIIFGIIFVILVIVFIVIKIKNNNELNLMGVEQDG